MTAPNLQTTADVLRHLGWPGILLLSVGGLIFYMLPSLIALMRRHGKAGPLAIANLVSGWSLAIWCGLLVWALTNGAGPQSRRSSTDRDE